MSSAPSVPPLAAAEILDAIAADPGVAALGEQLGSGEPLAIGGVHAGAVAPLVATLLGRGMAERLLVIAARDDEARLLARDVDALLGEANAVAHEIPPIDLGDETPRFGGPDDAALHMGPVSLGERLRGLGALAADADGAPAAVFASTSVLLEALPGPSVVRGSRRAIAVDDILETQELIGALVAHGYARVPMVEAEGEVAVRGGIIDVFSPGASHPWRIELFGDLVESIRSFDPGTQTSVETLKRIEIALVKTTELWAAARTDRASLVDYLSPEQASPGGSEPKNRRKKKSGARAVLVVEPEQVIERARHTAGALRDRGLAHRSIDTVLARAKERRVPVLSVRALKRSPDEAGVDVDTAPPLPMHGGELEATSAAVTTALARGDRMVIVARREPQAERIRELLEQAGLPPSGKLAYATSDLERGFCARRAGLVVATAQDLLVGVNRPVRARSRRRAETRAIDSFLDLAPGDFVVHINHGIGKFCGVERIEQQGRTRDCLKLEYKDGAILYVPAERLDLVQRYVGVKSMSPRLSSLQGQSWSKRTTAAKKAVMDLAADLLETQAERETRKGIKYPDDGEWQRAFEAAFPYEETDDQLKATAEVRDDMTGPQPMDRLICGDVGYGKTEIAMRGVFRAAMAGKQVAVLVPTTVLAQQHHDSFAARMAEWPIRVESLSRFRTPKQQKNVVEGLITGEVDVVIGTHRLLGEDVVFKDLGLVVIDEEQRFGVRHKERLRQLRSTVDVMTLTATPIPRTLHMSLVGIKTISALETPPPGRLAIRTEVRRFDRRLIRDAIRTELARDGQVYFVHDRVDTIGQVEKFVKQVVPEARTLIVHGQMPERRIEDQMVKFVRGLADVLVCTSIIESGLDIPRVNTIVINNADRFGLAELHQLRGRVGRYHHRAHCWLLVPADRPVNQPALERLQALAEYSELGAGFRIAMRDLEIRGSGNLLGAEQSGHIAQVGYELYCRLLKQAVEERRAGKKNRDLAPAEMEMALRVEAFVPEGYVPDVRLRIEVYRRLARAAGKKDVDALRRELKDRYGDVPQVVESLLRVRLLRCLLERLGVQKLWQEDKVVGMLATRMKPLLKAFEPVRERVRVVGQHELFLALDEIDPPAEQVLAQLLSWLGAEVADPTAARAR